MSTKNEAVLLLNLGGPDTPEVIRPFLYNLFSDRDIIPLGPAFMQKPIAWVISGFRASRTKKNYSLIGRASPLLKITLEQASALEKSLEGPDVFLAMRYWHPFISETVEKIHAKGYAKVLALPLYPHYSKATTGSCLKELGRVLQDKPKIHVSFIRDWYDAPGYLNALASTIKEGLQRFGDTQEVALLFSAHALPRSLIDEGDPYADQIKTTAKKVSELLGIDDWHISFQSRSGPVEWIKPDTHDMILELVNQGFKDILIVPISFVSDHIETLYEIDIIYKELGRKNGIRIERSPSLNSRPDFIEALKEILKRDRAIPLESLIKPLKGGF